MIARMSKYDLVLLAAQSDDFIERLRGLGLVDITAAGWEPSEEDRQLLLDIEGHAKAAEFVRAFREDADRFRPDAEPFATGEEAYAHYSAAQQQAAALNAEIGRLEKAADELRPWGEFSVERVRALAAQGIVLRYFFAPANNYDKAEAEWSARHTLSLVARTDATAYFVVVTAPGEEVAIDAQELKAPTMDIREAERRLAEAQEGLAALDAEFARVAVSEELLAQHAASLKERLQRVRVKATAQQAADGALVVMEGWAETVYIKSDPTPEDDTPVQLRNGWFARIFEMVGDMYARPKYGTVDLTPYFAPFYMLFFGICLNDAGYGLVLLAMGLWMLLKNPKPGMMRRAAWFATMCAGATVAFGLFSGSFFGMSLQEWFPSVPFFDFQGKFFSWALAIGVVQILFGMAINVFTITRSYGFKYALGPLGWLVILLAGSVAAGLPMLDPAWTIPGFTASSPAFYAALGAGAFLMLLLNTPGKFHNPLVNIGSGLWNLYNNLTGLLSDVLSYIRLFAIGLSGGVLALVFNSLAAGFVPEGAGWGTRLLVMVPILVIGHGINLFMSTISSFVHPMRLTFVEFYKNAGFEMASRSFDPIRKMNQTNE